MTKPAVQLIHPRDVGLPVLDGKTPVFDSDAVARADQTLKAMSGSFQQWLEADVTRLQHARVTAAQVGWTDAAIEQVMCVAHDIKGMGASYGYPLATQIAASLCRLTETASGKNVVRNAPGLAEAHVDALRAVMRDQIKTSEHAIGRALLRALDSEVERLGVAPR